MANPSQKMPFKFTLTKKLQTLIIEEMTKEGISQSQLAERSGIVRQRICDYLANRRRITVEASLNLEKALRIGIEGFFYRIQANHDIYMRERTGYEQPSESGTFPESCLWGY